MKNTKQIKEAYAIARERYAEQGVDAEKAIKRLARISLSLHCWQGDDVVGFEKSGEGLSGGIAVTGHYPGRARTADELRQDLELVLRMIPGRHRVNLHAIYAETGRRRADRNELEPRHFSRWIDWAKAQKLGLDFNPTFFSHPKAADGFTLSHPDKGIRGFWVEHGLACRKISEAMGRALGTPCVHNVWIPDGSKDVPADRLGPRLRLQESLDAIFAGRIAARHVRDSVEGKLFGIGSESYVVGSHEFYLGYALANRKMVTLDTGHYHPTEQVSDKLSALLIFLDEVLLHVSRGVRWDSDHVVTFTDELQSIACEIVRGGFLDRVIIALDYFDGSINRPAAWIVGARNTQKALLYALLEPSHELRRREKAGDLTGRLALMEEAKTLPFGAVWDYHCLKAGAPVGSAWLAEIESYEKRVLSKRG